MTRWRGIVYGLVMLAFVAAGTGVFAKEALRIVPIVNESDVLVSFELADGIDCFDFLNRLDIVVSSSNLGDNRTLAIPVAHTIFYEMGAERRAAMGIADSLVRVSVGIEDRDDLIGDFAQALRG